MNTEIFVDTNFAWNSIDLRLRVGRKTMDGDVINPGEWMKEPLLVKVEEFTTPPVALRLEHLEAQALMDRLWKAGLRPTEGSGSAGALAATQDHLKDMQTLVFKHKTLEASVQEIMQAIRREERRGSEVDNSLLRKLTGEE